MIERLRSWLKENNMTQADLAVAMGFHPGSVRNVMSSGEPPSEFFIGKFFLAFGAEATERVFGQPTQEQPA
jgi:transcriptional regulator with XRE-family HTH domain